MKSSMKKLIAICIVASIATITFGCSSGKNNQVKETISLEDTKQELQFYYNTGDVEDATEAVESNVETAEPATEIVTEYVDVTDADGQQVTEADGSVQTEVHTEVVTVPAVPNTPSKDDYTPAYDTCKAYWLDMSQAGDFTFNGELLVISFEIKEEAPDGNYPITISNTDIGSWDVVTRVPECINGEISVGNSKPSAQKEASADKFTLTVNNTSGKPGDIVDVAIDMKNNPGFCGFIIDIQYDTNALSIVDTSGGADFDKAIKYVP